MKILDYLGLTTLVDFCKEYFAKINHTHKVADLEDYTVDSTFSATSENPIQNKAVNEALLTIANDLDTMEASIDAHKDDVDNPHEILEKIEANSDLVVTDESDEIVGDGVDINPAIENKINAVENRVTELENGSANVQADWNQNDETAADYIKNRTHWKEGTINELIPETVIPIEDPSVYPQESYIELAIEKDKTYIVTWNGVEYTCVGKTHEMYGMTFYYLGNARVATLNTDNDTGEPFAVVNDRGSILVFAESAGNHNIKISENNVTYHKIPLEYLPEMSSVGKDVEGQLFTIDGETVEANVGAEIFNDYENNVATGEYSHAEGQRTTASGMYSHAEGEGTTASGMYSHAEGEGTVASKTATHAEGLGTKASGQYSHAEGVWTIAASKNQHVQGKYNVEDATNKYAHIVGNGTSSARSNAHTLDWNGNAWFAGNVYVGGTSQDDANAKKLATEDYVNEKCSGGAYGKILFIDMQKDANGDIICKFTPSEVIKYAEEGTTMMIRYRITEQDQDVYMNLIDEELMFIGDTFNVPFVDYCAFEEDGVEFKAAVFENLFFLDVNHIFYLQIDVQDDIVTGGFFYPTANQLITTPSTT